MTRRRVAALVIALTVACGLTKWADLTKHDTAITKTAGTEGQR